MLRVKDVNRRWLNQVNKSKSLNKQYFAGTTTREVALSIVSDLDMHSSYVGKVDDLLTKLIKQGHFKISNGRLVTCDPLPSARIDHRAARRRRIAQRRRISMQGKQQYRAVLTGWHAEMAA